MRQRPVRGDGMKALLLVSELEDYTISFANGLARRMQVVLVVPRRRYAGIARWIDPAVDTRLLDWPRHRSPANPLFLLNVISLVRRERPDVVHLLSNNTLWLNLALPFWRAFPVLTTVHDVDVHPGDTETATLPEWATSLVVRQSGDIVVHGEELRRRAIERWAKQPDRVHVLPHPAITRYAELALREGLTRRHPDGAFTVLMFGRICAYKGLEQLIRAEAKLAGRIPNLRIVIAGRGDDPWSLRGMMGDEARYDIRDRFIEDREVAQLFLDADVVALPYVEASQSGVLNLAAAFGRPVIATDVGELRATVEPNRLGLVIPPGDPDRLADSIAFLAERPAVVAELGANARAWAYGSNAPEAVGGAAAALYQRIIERAGGRRLATSAEADIPERLPALPLAPREAPADPVLLRPPRMQREPTVIARHYLPGGRENGGGIGRLVGYIVDAAAHRDEIHQVTDTRGPGWSIPSSVPRLFGAVLSMARDRVAAPERIQHIHAAGRGSTMRKVILAATARGLGCRHVMHLHDYDYAPDFARRPRWQKALVRRAFQGADRVLVLGRRDRQTAMGLLGVEADRVVVMRNCVPDPGPRRRPPVSVPSILFLGQLGPRKGVPELLSALGSPVMARSGWRAVLAGDGPAEIYRREADRLGLNGRVTLPGWVDETETRALCAAADILVLPSHQEGMAMAVIEGLAHGLAVVTTRVGAHEEVITDGVTGVFVPVGDEAELANALARLVADTGERERIATAGRALYLARFGMAAYMGALDDIYAASLSQHLTAAPAE